MGVTFATLVLKKRNRLLPSLAQGQPVMPLPQDWVAWPPELGNMAFVLN